MESLNAKRRDKYDKAVNGLPKIGKFFLGNGVDFYLLPFKT